MKGKDDMAGNTPLVSIISPVYNTPENCFWRAVESVFAQVYRNFELVLVDDGSEVDCASLCDEAAARDNRVRVIHQENKGFAGAMNTGIQSAHGDFVMFMDPDDEIPCYVLEHAVELARKTGCDMVCSSSVLRFPSRDVIGTFGIEKGDYRILDDWERECYRVFCLTSLLPTGSPKWFQEGLRRGHVAKLIARDLFDTVRLEETMCAGSDSLMVADLIAGSRSVAFVNESWYFYYMNSFSVTHTYSFEKDEKEFRAMELRRASYGDDYYAACFARYCDTATRVSSAGLSALRGLAAHLSTPNAKNVFSHFESSRYQLGLSRRLVAQFGKRGLGGIASLLYCMKSVLSSNANEAFS